MKQEIAKDDKEHLKLINAAIRASNVAQLSELMNDKVYPEDYLRKSFSIACVQGDLNIVSFLMTSKSFSPNPLYVRGIEELFRYKHEPVINWLIFDYKMYKSGAVEEMLIEMGFLQS